MNLMKVMVNRTLTMDSKATTPALVGVPQTSQLKQEMTGFIQKRAVAKKMSLVGLQER